MINIFDVIPLNFFNIFSGTDKRSYSDFLFLLYGAVDGSNEYVLTRLLATDLIEDYLKKIDDEVSDRRNKANTVLNNLKRSGWIEENIGKDYQRILSFTDNGLDFIHYIKDSRREIDIEYSGYFNIIFTLLNGVHLDNVYINVDSSFKNTQDLIQKLRGLNTTIKKYIEKLMDKEIGSNPQSLLNLLGTEYQMQVVDRAYYNLTTKDNPAKYSRDIVEALNTIMFDNDLFDRLVLDASDRRGLGMAEAEHMYLTMLKEMVYEFTNISQLISEIDQRNAKFVSDAISKIIFHLNHSKSIEGKINTIITDLMTSDLEMIDVPIHNTRLVDPSSTFTPKNYTPYVPVELVETTRLSDQHIELQALQLLEPEKYSQRRVMALLDMKLQFQESVKLSEFDDNEITLAVLMFIYTKSKGHDYSVENTGEQILVGKFECQDYIIRRNYE